MITRFLKPTAWIRALVVPLLILAFVLGYWLRGRGHEPEPTLSRALGGESATSSPMKAQRWTCAMHPSVNATGPGKCPICFMDLVPVEEAAGYESERVLVITEAAKALAEIETAPVERKFVDAEIRMVGKVEYDETKVAYITAWMPGRLDRLFVDSAGVPVRKDEHLISIYSPELYWAQQALIEAAKSVKEIERSASAMVKEITAGRVEAARDKLRLLGLSPDQVAEVELTGKSNDHVTIHAPIGGIVVRKDAVEGMYVETGTQIYTIADLSTVWVLLDAYESDLMWIRYGQDVEFETEAYPGRRFAGRISLIDPILNAMTRTVKVRLNVANAEGVLLPGMFVRAILRPKVASDGRVMDAQLAGKWICSMHPEIIKDEPGLCDECRMPLVRAESLGYVSLDETSSPPLVVPATAALLTGKRAVVYVEVPNKDRPTYEGREVTLGPRAGDFYIVRSGLQEGERVVTRGSFKLDSELQIKARPSMMAMTGGPEPQPVADKPEVLDVPEAFRRQLAAVLEAYLAVGQALSEDDSPAAGKAADAVRKALDVVDMTLIADRPHKEWMKIHNELDKALQQFAEAKDIAEQRKTFALLSDSLTAAVLRFGHGLDKSIYRIHCPMAFNNRGADWLQDSDQIRNPYFGGEMLACGEVKAEIAPGAAR